MDAQIHHSRRGVSNMKKIFDNFHKRRAIAYGYALLACRWARRRLQKQSGGGRAHPEDQIPKAVVPGVTVTVESATDVEYDDFEDLPPFDPYSDTIEHGSSIESQTEEDAATRV